MHIQSLILEITRRCNLRCKHCLRGQSNPVDMKQRTIERALNGITSIGSINFTGGEPTLNVPAIKFFTDYIRKSKIKLGSFFIITNGKIASRTFVRELKRLARLCTAPDDNRLMISGDQYHKSYNRSRALKLYGKLPFYSDEREYPIELLIDEGDAKANGLGVREPTMSHPVVTKNAIHSEVYVNVYGDVIPSCEMSYVSQENETLGSALGEPIVKIFRRYAKSLKS